MSTLLEVWFLSSIKPLVILEQTNLCHNMSIWFFYKCFGAVSVV